MITKSSFTEEHVRFVQKKCGKDPGMIERVIFAFEMLESLCHVGLPFIFKGGTSLMLLFPHPRRFSTDIDIIVEPGTDLDAYIEKASEIWPFLRCDEQKRRRNDDIEKRHFKFVYHSPIRAGEFYILLDVLFEHNPYPKINSREIKCELFESETPYFFVKMPSAEGMLGDKMTAFAPHTTGIPFHVGKEQEIVKQLYDICGLCRIIKDFNEVKLAFQNVVMSEISYRGGGITQNDVLLDVFRSAACLAGKGLVGDKEEYALFVEGTRRLQPFIYLDKFNAEIAPIECCRVMFVAMGILMDRRGMELSEKLENYRNKLIAIDEFKRLKYIKSVNLEAYAYLIEALEMYGDTVSK